MRLGGVEGALPCFRPGKWAFYGVGVGVISGFNGCTDGFNALTLSLTFSRCRIICRLYVCLGQQQTWFDLIGVNCLRQGGYGQVLSRGGGIGGRECSLDGRLIGIKTYHLS